MLYGFKDPVSAAIIEPFCEPKVIVPLVVDTIEAIFKSSLFVIAISPFALALSLLTSIFILSFFEVSRSMEPFSALNSRESAVIFTELPLPPSCEPAVPR